MPLEAGDYGCLEGTWWVRPPRGGVSPIPGEQVLEHEDGTITVSPSILIRWVGVEDGAEVTREWHGYLRRGVWETC